MMMYLLLRDNKQSGPYSLDDLKTMGLKAYDLVWVDGKSAAWRYPCEINELSAFAPAVEEQPFDRFFKKTSPVQANNSSSVGSDSPRPVSESSTAIYETVKGETQKSEPSTVPGKRIIYVTMPAGNAVQPVHKPAPTPIGYEFEDNSAQRLPEETPVVEFMPRFKKRRSNFVLRPLLIGLALLAVGIFIGLSINKDTLSFSKIRWGSKSHDADNGQVTHTIAQQLPAPAVKNEPVPVVTDPQPDTVTTISGQPGLSDPASSPTNSEGVGADRSVVGTSVGSTGSSAVVVTPGTSTGRPGKTTAQKAKPVNGNARPQVLSASPGRDSASGALSVVHREAMHRTEVEEKPDVSADKDAGVKANIASQVSVGANGYTVGTFGGINDLQVTVTNRSVYPLDLVVVEVQYIQSNKKIYKTENLYFRSIGAGSALMQEAPKSSRGIKVLYKITMINSKELGLSYSGI